MTKKWNLMRLKGRIHHLETTQDRTGQAKLRCCSPCCEACGPNLRRNRQKKQRKITKSTTTVTNCCREEKHRGKPKKMANRTQHEGKTECAKESHDRCSQPPGMSVLKTTDLGTQALLVVNSFKVPITPKYFFAYLSPV